MANYNAYEATGTTASESASLRYGWPGAGEPRNGTLLDLSVEATALATPASPTVDLTPTGVLPLLVRSTYSQESPNSILKYLNPLFAKKPKWQALAQALEQKMEAV